MAYDPAEYQVVVSADGVVCEHPRRPRETIDWAVVADVFVVTHVDGPWPADAWLWLTSADRSAQCSVPYGAPGFPDLLDHLCTWPGFNRARYEAALAAEVTQSVLCWTRP